MHKQQKQLSQSGITDKLNHWLRQHEKVLFWILFGTSLVFSFFLFNLRVSEGGDDSTYIIKAVNLLNNGKYPAFQGPLYPIFLSLIISITGLKLGILKLTSLVFIAITYYLFYKTFRNRIAPVLLFSTLLLLSFNSYYLYFASQTYSEAMFMAIQGWFLLSFFKFLDQPEPLSIKKTLLLFLPITAILVFGFQTRTIGLGGLIAVVTYFLIIKDFKKAGLFFLSFLLVLAPVLVLKNIIWEIDLGSGNQASTLLYKHPYDFSQGKESITGFFQRFVDNSNLYLSKHFLKAVGLRALKAKTRIPLFTIILYLVFIKGFVSSLKEKRHLLFTGIYLAFMLGITFIVLQKIWDQYRLIIPFLPLMILFLLYSLDKLTNVPLLRKIKGLVPALVVICGLASFGQTLSKMDLMVLRQNFKGNKYEGYSLDWKNYLQMTEYAGTHLNEKSYTACRKPNMARIYSNGKPFYGIYRFDTTDADSLLARLKERHVSYIIMASLRKNPEVNNGQTINTIKRYMAYIAQKYPYVFELKHRIGKNEPAYLFYINYDNAKTLPNQSLTQK
ncbi:hypothetical protein DMA11_20700 [Marinilabiliaceae bacterium JC017]|nr:hypothetical protein DMA11_20700 [Marinilabiliaceae bacterium JC017]